MNYRYLCNFKKTFGMTKSYKVAEHIFNLTLPDGSAIWEQLGQYSPFMLDEVCKAPLFSLEMVAELPQGELSTVFLPETEDGETVIRLYHMGEDWVFDASPDHRIPTTARTWTSKDFKQGKIAILDRKMRSAVFGINNALMLLFAFNTASLGTLEMHASMVSNSGKAFLFIARSGTGKSTHSQQWLNFIPGTELMNDDNPIIRVWPDGRVTAYGSPWSGKTPCYRNVEAPVGAIVRIRRCPENKITRFGVLDAYASVYSSCSGFKAQREMADGLHATLEVIATGVPCYVLDCRPDQEAAEVCSKEVLK